jgi:hypothetical protein
VGFDPEISNYPWVIQDTENMEDVKMFNGWEIEENFDGFYLMFIGKNYKKFYLGNSEIMGIVEMFEEKNTDLKVVYDDDGTTIMQKPTKRNNFVKYKLHIVARKDGLALSTCWFDNGKISNKIRLTRKL